MIVVRLLALVFDVLLLPLRALRRAAAVPTGSFVVIEIDGPVVDLAPRPRFWEVRTQKATSLWRVSQIVDRVITDARVRGIVVVVKDFGGGLASAASLRAHLARARAAGKEVIAYLPMGGGSKEVLAATGASKVVLAPATQLAPLGFVSSTRYLKRALDRAGVEPDVIAAGKYKSAGENLTRDAMSAPQREQVDALLDGCHDALLEAIAEGRAVAPERARAIVDGAPYFGEAAIAAGLADALAYEDELPAVIGLDAPERKKAKRGGGGSASRRMLDGDAYLALVTRPLVRRLFARPVIAVVPVHGAIAHASGLFGGFATDERVTRMLRIARVDRRVRGVILHVDSPGGSALASDRMHHEIVQLAREKPVVACMANVAASGGYYVAAPAHKIVCEATTITGSIGVVAARLSVEPLLARLGVSTETVRRGARAGLLAPSLPLSDEEHGALERLIDATYKTFVSIVAKGRKMREEDVEPLARGRVYLGQDALGVGLVDALGGFDVAVRELRAMLPEELRARAEPVTMRQPRRSVPPLDAPNDGEAGRRAAAQLVASLLPNRERALALLAASGERILALWLGSID